MDEELDRIVGALQQRQTRRVASRDVHHGLWLGHPVVAVRSGVGKVAAAVTAAVLLAHCRVRALVFSGVAGGLGSEVRIGDWVIADALLQHDLDASPIFPRWEVPYSGRSRFAADATLTQALANAANALCAAVDAQDLARQASLGIVSPRVHRGLVISGDRFVHRSEDRAALQCALPDALAVEMEGAAMAQVAHDFGVPVAVVRSISDQADSAAAVDFGRYVSEHAAVSGERLLRLWLASQPIDVSASA